MKRDCRILVIDDEDIVRISCKRALLSEGCIVDTAASGAEGLELFKNGRYDLVLVDLKMPGMDGIDVLMNIKGQKPDQRVIMMTGYDTAEHIDTITLAGATDCIGKPFTPDALVELISTVMEKES